MSNTTICIIPARSGSKRIKNKNIRSFLGKPIISYAIQTSLSSNIFDEVMVSTECNEIKNLSISLGAKVPFIRSNENSDDFATTADVLLEVIDCYKKQNIFHDYICCIYPTSVFVTEEILKRSLEYLIDTNSDSVMPVVKYSYPIQRSLLIVQEKIKMFWPENYNTRSQDLTPSYHDAGQFYFIKTSSFLKEKKLFMSDTRAIILPDHEVQDIDNEADWKLAELKYSMRNQKY
jgi:pseudaminic acid cytidylyltransferase